MSTKENKELIRSRIAEFADVSGNAAKIRAWCDKYYAPGVVCHWPDRDFTREQLIEVWASSGLTDIRWVADDMVSEDDKVVLAYTLYGTHTGPFMGIPATGKKLATKAIVILKISGGKIVEMWEVVDALGVMTQLGTIPAAGAKK